MSKRSPGMQMALPIINGPAIGCAYVERNGFVSRIVRYEDEGGQRVTRLEMSCDLAMLPDVPGHWIELFAEREITQHVDRARAAQAAKLARSIVWHPKVGERRVMLEDPFGRMGPEPRAWSAGPDPVRTAEVRAIVGRRVHMEFPGDPIEEVRRAHGK